MAERKVGRAALLRMQADLAEAEESFVALKSKRRRCSECGRPLHPRDQTANDQKVEAQIRGAALALRAMRQKTREAEGR